MNSTKAEVSTETIDVGPCEGGRIFIAAPEKRHDVAKTPLTGSVKHILTFTRDDVEWLLKALRKELRRKPKQAKESSRG